MNRPDKYRTFAWAFLAYTVLVVLWGAFVRATGSGAGCGDHWPLCNGEVMPRSPTMETIVELTHRITSGLSWLLALVGVLFARAAFPRGHRVRKAAFATLVLMSTEGVVGAALVLRELVAEDASGERGFFMALHLVNTFLLLASMTLGARFADGAAPPRFRAKEARSWLIVAVLASVLALGVSGAITALGDTLFPVASLADGISRDFSASAHLFERLRVLHPVLGLATAALVLALAGTAIGAHGMVRRGGLVIALFAAQVGLGFLNVALLAPVWLQIAHLLVADGIWISLVVLCLALLEAPARSDLHHDLPHVDPARGERVA